FSVLKDKVFVRIVSETPIELTNEAGINLRCNIHRAFTHHGCRWSDQRHQHRIWKNFRDSVAREIERLEACKNNGLTRTNLKERARRNFNFLSSRNEASAMPEPKFDPVGIYQLWVSLFDN